MTIKQTLIVIAIQFPSQATNYRLNNNDISFINELSLLIKSSTNKN